MALITCPECGKMVSEFAEVCIGCGYPLENIKKPGSAKSSFTVENQVGPDYAGFIAAHPECLDNAQKLRSYLTDMFPELQDRAKITMLGYAFEVGAVQELKKAPDDALLPSRMVTAMVDRFVVERKAAEWAVDEWCKAFRIKTEAPQIIETPSTVEKPSTAETPTAIETKISLPADIDEYTVVVGEGRRLVYGDLIESSKQPLVKVRIADGFTEIGWNAFRGCSSLTSVVIPDSVTTIGWNAFEGCSSLTNIVIPDSVTTICKCAFSGCSSLTSVVIPNSVTTIGEWSFMGCSSLTDVVIPNGVKTIDNGAFYRCSSLTSVVIPDSVTKIGVEVFQNCNSLTIRTPNGSYAARYAKDNRIPVEYI